MIVRPLAKVCGNETCKKEPLVYQKGEGRFACPKCCYSTSYFAGDSLVFLFAYEKLPATKKRIAVTEWTLKKVYCDSDWTTELKKLPKPRVAVYWSVPHGCKLYSLHLGDVKIEAQNRFSPPYELIDELVGDGFGIYAKIENFIKEWAAGISFPDDWQDYDGA